MSLLLRKFLRQAEAQLQQGAAAEAEAQCCQVLTGAVELHNAPLMAESAQLLCRIPQKDLELRIATLLGFSNFISTMQNGKDLGTAVDLCDVLFEASRGMPFIRMRALEMGAFMANKLDKTDGRAGRYLEQLLAFEGRGPAADETLPLEQQFANGPQPVARVLAGRGACLLHGMFDPETIGAVRRVARDFFWGDPSQAVPISRFPESASLMTGAPEAFFSEALADFFPYRPHLQAHQSFVRRVEPTHPESTVPFHQDVTAFGQLMVNVWTPLVPCGRTAPSLELVARRAGCLIETGPGQFQYSQLQISDALIVDRFGADSLFRAEMEPGDVLIFLGTTIHRTYITPAMTEQRISLELRFGV